MISKSYKYGLEGDHKVGFFIGVDIVFCERSSLDSIVPDAEITLTLILDLLGILPYNVAVTLILGLSISVVICKSLIEALGIGSNQTVCQIPEAGA